MAAPVVTSVSPNVGPPAGGATVTLTGTGFTGTTTVKFGSNAAPSFTVVSATQISAVTPAGTGAVNVTVTNSEGTSAQVVTYTYVPAPTLSSLSPGQGPAAGGTSVTLTGTNLSGATAVRFDAIASPSFTVVSATQITAWTPRPRGRQLGGHGDHPRWHQQLPHVLLHRGADRQRPEPHSGSRLGRHRGDDSRRHQQPRQPEYFDSTAATSFTVNSSTQITATAPAHAAATAAVTVTAAGGTSNPLSYDYLNAPTLTSLTPVQGPTYAGTPVLLTGTNLATTTGVLIGGIPASFSVVSPTQVTASVPVGSPGPVTVTVTTTAGVSNGLTYTRVNGPAV
ncbi:IPT/TIG domain-containing protein [Streptomyces sp. NPDC047022]|uniref:IPT/TIG domain-containing protein n=1 Tax=Streptomyces sp. NPDC047022 TaxID=3155737 RepID=UPI0033D69583